MRFDAEQTEAIQTTGTNILVSASAGAGKTGVLVGRLRKRCVDDRIPINRILAMTFTQAAAAEMKKRLAKELHNSYTNASDPEEKDWLQKQITALASADITTIDSYCLTVIQKYCNVIGLDPAIAENILDDGTRNLFLRQAFDETLKSFYEKDPEKTTALCAYFSPRSEDYETLYDIVKKINDHAQADIDPDTWYAQARFSYHTIHSLSDLDPAVSDAFFGYLKVTCRRMMDLLTLMEQDLMDDEKVSPETLLPKKNALTNCLNALEEKNYSLYCTSLDNFALTETKASGKNAMYKDHRDKVENLTKRLLGIRYDEKMLIDDHNDLTEICGMLTDLARLSYERFTEIKQEQACMDFSDMERYAFNILKKNNGTVAGIIRDSLDEIMVDEFQDTSALQNAVIETISNGRNVFRVGDVKQSIYRFRQAKPQLMRSLMQDENTKQITLRHNYRSKESIVRFSNLLFSKIMNVPGTKDTYLEEDTVSIGAEHQKEKPVPVVYALLPAPDKDDEESPGAKLLKARWIAAKILQMKQEDPSASFRDFAVLVKAHADKIVLRVAFDEYGIPYDIDAREGFYQSILCQTVLAMIRFMLDESDRISLLSVLTSSFYRMDDNRLAELKIMYGSVYEGIMTEYPQIIAEMRELRDIARHGSITEMLTEIANRHDFFAGLDDRQKANFDFFFEKAVRLDRADLYTFLKEMEAGEEEKSSEAASRGSDDDIVTVTTIHQSKGLQYKNVFLWATSRNDFNDGRNAVIIDDTLKLGIPHLTMPYRAKRTTLQKIAVEYQANLEDMEEFTRLLYVAVTRAESRLFIVDSINKDFPLRDITLSLLADRKGMSGLILSALPEGPLFQRIDAEPADVQPLPAQRERTVEHLPVFEADAAVLRPVYTPSSLEFRKLPDLGRKEQGGRRHGTLVHEVIEKLPDRQWTEEELMRYPLSANDRKKILCFSDSELYRKALSMEIHKEYPFYVENKEMRMFGVMDFVAVGDDEILLLDFKTDNASAGEIRRRYSDQINAYRTALRMIYPDKKISAYAWSFHNDTEIEIH